MKKLLVIYVFLFCSKVHSQGFFDSSIHYLTIGSITETPTWFYHNSYHMIRDSVASDTEYYSLKNQWGISTYWKFKVNGKRVYHSGSPWKDALLYDFSLAEGDSSYIFEHPPNSQYKGSLIIVDSIRPVMLGPFTYSAHYVRFGNGRTRTFVENIGSMENGVLFYEYHAFESSSELIMLCREDTLMFWKNHMVIKTGHNTCHPMFLGIEQTTIDKMHDFLYPNPSDGDVHIFAGNVQPGLSIAVYSISGQLLKCIVVQDSPEIDLTELPAGLYCIRLLSPHGNRQQILSIN